MRPETLILWLLFSGSVCAGAATIEKKFTAEQVIDALGEPIGTIKLSKKTLYLYPQGEVTMKAGVVSDFELMDEEAYLAEQERRRIEREEWQAEQEQRAARQREEGQALKTEKMQSQAFASLPAKDRVDFWRRFQARFPSVDVSDQLATALQSYETELAQLRREERISDLETRVAQAEREAAAARLETEKLREETERLRNRASFGVRTHTTRARHYPVYYRPPTVTIHSNGSNPQCDDDADTSNLQFNHNKLSKGHSAKTPLGLHFTK
ncbi:MAG: hypothetical protein GVY36_05375 [Verrucomicrobia bacterium]|jgi:hypothetical protein|nr:hypothetical protein [Verrucomicrobiota bacterium]